MTKQLHKLFLPALALLFAVGSYAQDAEINGIYYNLNKTAQTASVTYRGSWALDFQDEYTGDLVIPASVDYDGTTYAVTGIGYEACAGCCGLTSVTFPESVTSIGENAFAGCNGLTSIDIPSTMTYIGDGAFAGCLGLKSINVSSDNPIYCSIDGILYSKDRHTLRAYPGSRSGAVTIAENVTGIGYDAFSGCKNLTSVTIPETVTYIGGHAFYSCTGLTSIVIPEGVTDIGGMAFGCCTNLASVSLPESVTRIGHGAFYECSSLSAISIPESVTSIGESTFANCTALTSITIPKNVTTLGEYSFEGCTRLTSVSFLSSETNIKHHSFNGCSSLTAIYSFGSVPPEVGYQCFDDTHYQTATLYVPQEAIAAYRAAETWKEFRNIQGFDPTGINGIEADGNNGKEACYDLAGRRLNAPKKGVNIINGKKVMMR